jgi:endonuclease/exonuclease/phosphatase family metal-dependent hydrolase
MRTALIALLLASVGFAEGTITIATLNCQFLTRPKVHVKFGLPFFLRRQQREQWDAPGFREEKVKQAAALVAKAVLATGADVIVLTEIGDEKDVAALQAETKVYPHAAVGSFEDPETFQRVAVLSKFPLKNVVRRIPGIALYRTEDDDAEQEAEADLGKAIRVEFEAHGKTFVLYGLHLKSERGGHASDAWRIAQAGIARRHMLPDIRAGKLVVVAGDLNDMPNQPAIRRLRGFDDIDEELFQTGHSFYWPDNALDQRWTYEYRGQRQLIDHILVSSAVRDACLPNPDPRKERNRRAERMGIAGRAITVDKAASDHRALAITLRLR